MQRLMTKYVHLLGKESRQKIIEILADERGVRELANELDITPAAVSKYLSGLTHPSDLVIERAIKIANEDEIRKIAKIVEEEFIEGLTSFVEWSVDKGVLDTRFYRRLNDITAKVGLVTLSQRDLNAS
ncbi:putative transcriptional regulator [Caldisphaera lagunensis DSM 15908]|uniref:Putative transcriptional regulator n=2 Tax=Caldisphaera lagunensis TaxID=200415 RepID=L0ABH0_CALLD|nr:putative transcriptional regulator [Caldisphaera lagunensis DSM 15908]